MNAIHRIRNTTIACIMTLVMIFAFTGCGSSTNPAQKEAFEKAQKMEQAYTFETAEMIIAEYQKVIAIEPGSKLAEKAEVRLKLVESKFESEEQHKSVFHEHGID